MSDELYIEDLSKFLPVLTFYPHWHGMLTQYSVHEVPFEFFLGRSYRCALDIATLSRLISRLCSLELVENMMLLGCLWSLKSRPAINERLLRYRCKMMVMSLACFRGIPAVATLST